MHPISVYIVLLVSMQLRPARLPYRGVLQAAAIDTLLQAPGGVGLAWNRNEQACASLWMLHDKTKIMLSCIPPSARLWLSFLLGVLSVTGTAPERLPCIPGVAMDINGCLPCGFAFGNEM